MPYYVKLNADGSIGSADTAPHDGFVAVDYDCVYVGCRWHKKGMEPAGPSATDLLFVSLRAARNARLTATDKYLLPDFPVSDSDLSAIKEYRQALRDIPAQPGAPWDGGGELTPWPELPSVG